MPSLDGVRAIAILAVISLHLSQTEGTAGVIPIDGVGIFFVLSGFLITSLLVREQISRGRIDLKLFYARRTVRIFPAMYFYLLVSFVVCLIIRPLISWQAVASAGLYVRDYIAPMHGPNDFLVEHTWSLAVEEQFYFFYPALFAWIWKKYGRSTLIKVTACLILIPLIARLVTGVLGYHINPYMFHNRADALMAGCTMALCVGTRRFELFYERTARYIWIVASLFCAFTLINYISPIHWRHSFGFTIEPVLIAFLLIWLVRNPETAIGRILNSKPMKWIGIRSYSIYLYQTMMLHRDTPIAHGILRSMWIRLALVFIAGWSSYRFVEQPFLWLRKRLNPMSSTAEDAPKQMQRV